MGQCSVLGLVATIPQAHFKGKVVDKWSGSDRVVALVL